MTQLSEHVQATRPQMGIAVIKLLGAPSDQTAITAIASQLAHSASVRGGDNVVIHHAPDAAHAASQLEAALTTEIGNQIKVALAPVGVS